MVHNKTIFTITEIIFPQQGMVYQGITIVHERLEEKKLNTNQKSETWKQIWNFHFHYKLSMYLEKCFGPTALKVYLQHRLKTYCVFLKTNRKQISNQIQNQCSSNNKK